MYFSSSVWYTESDVNMHLAWTAIYRLLIIWKFLPSSVCINTTVWMHHMDADKTYREKGRQELQKNATSYIEQILEVTFHETTAVWPFTAYL